MKIWFISIPAEKREGTPFTIGEGFSDKLIPPPRTSYAPVGAKQEVTFARILKYTINIVNCLQDSHQNHVSVRVTEVSVFW